MRRLARAGLAVVVLQMVAWPALGQNGKVARAGKADASLVAAGRQGAVFREGDALAGKVKSGDERCQECHGHDGNANDIQDGVGNIGKFPRLAGQNVEYILKQLSDFRSGKRNNEIMSIMAKTVSDADLADIAAYFSGQSPLPGDGQGDNPLGRKLFTDGDPGRGLLPCAACHEQREKAVAGEAPLLAGQHRRYLQKQLREWRAGERHNSPGAVMNTLAKVLSDSEIDALADYVSGL